MTGERPLTVAIFGESYLPYLSGVTVATEALARGLGAAGQHVVLAVPRPADPRGRRLGGGSAAGEGARLAGVPTAGAAGPDPRIAWLPSYQGPPPAPPGYRMPRPVPSTALSTVLAARPDVVHAQSPFVSGLMAMRVARRLGAPLVLTHHTRFSDYRHYLGRLAAPGARLTGAYLRAFEGRCAAVVAPAADLAAEIEAGLAGAGSRRTRPLVRAIPTGLDLEGLRRLARVDPRPTAGWPAETVVAVSVGRLAREKRSDLLLDAFADAVRREPRLRLLLIGDGPLRAELAARVSGGPLAGLVHLAGRLPRLDALALAAGADLFAFASNTETQGLVLAEALAVGLPVVALDGPGVRDSVRDGIDGIVVPPGAGAPATDLGRSMAALAADDGRRRALARAAEREAERFSSRAWIDQMLELYRFLLARRGPA